MLRRTIREASKSFILSKETYGERDRGRESGRGKERGRDEVITNERLPCQGYDPW